ncbi:hypothetical protein BC834DRAFT_488017 [Gloeopeniophorella convolvens]|nr:hypothetical protein BC834DRAFT_488017 [Gloeopeniophorella convolvens]
MTMTTTTTTTPAPHLLALPTELVLKILESGDHHAILAAKSTCRSLYALVAGSVSLQYALALAAAGMRDGAPSALGKAQRLAMLSAHTAAWRSLAPATSAPLDALAGWGTPVAVSGGVLAFRAPARLKRDVPDEGEELLLLRAPSALRGVSMRRWTVALPRGTRDVCIDAAQDLLICHSGTKTFHALSLSTGTPHPLAQRASPFEATNSWRYRTGSMRLCGAHLALASEQGLYISVFAWRSGAHISDFMAALEGSTFDFLDAHHVLFPSAADDSLYVYDVRAMPPLRARRPKARGTHCFELAPAQLRAGDMIDVRCAPAGSPDGAFAGVDADAERAVRVHALAGGAQLHVRARALLRWAAAHPAPPGACVVVPWAAWGGAGARVVVGGADADVDADAAGSACGARVARVCAGGTRLAVADYHPARVRAAGLSEHARRAERGVALQGRAGKECAPGSAARVRSKSVPLPIFTSSLAARSRSATSLLRDLILGAPAHVPAPVRVPTRSSGAKLRFSEAEIGVPEGMRGVEGLSVLLCEDAVLLYKVRFFFCAVPLLCGVFDASVVGARSRLGVMRLRLRIGIPFEARVGERGGGVYWTLDSETICSDTIPCTESNLDL